MDSVTEDRRYTPGVMLKPDDSSSRAPLTRVKVSVFAVVLAAGAPHGRL